MSLKTGQRTSSLNANNGSSHFLSIVYTPGFVLRVSLIPCGSRFQLLPSTHSAISPLIIEHSLTGSNEAHSTQTKALHFPASLAAAM
jgi:hypothetical protein